MKKYKWIIWIVVAAAASTGIWYWKFRQAPTEIVLSTEHPAIGSLNNSVTATGTLQPVDTVAVGTQISGTILKVYADFNSVVKKGQLLAVIDKSLLQAQVAQISANLQSARANITYSKSNYDRQNQLFTVGAISKAELETALYQYRSASENVSSIAAQLSSAQKNLSYSEIYSPIDGTILSRSVSEGQTVAASLSTPTLFSIAKDLTKMQVQAAVDEADIGNVKIGQRVMFAVDAFPADTFSGTVKEVRLRPSVSSNVVTYTTIIDAPNQAEKLKPGMTASITIYTKELKDVMTVSARSVQFTPDSIIRKKYTVNETKAVDGAPAPATGSRSAFVWLKKDSSLVRQPIVTGMDDETQVQVLSGLNAADLVVSGYQQVERAAVQPADKSPFLPSRPGGSSKKNQGPPPN